MLEFSRDFIQGEFGDLINYALHNKKKYIVTSKSLYAEVPPKKFNEPKFKRSTMDDFIQYFYDKVNMILSNRYRVKPLVIYGDTDSVFFTPKIHDIETKTVKTDRAALKVCIEIGMLAGDTICKILPEPEEQVYEKTLWPFVILTKKRYVGNLYEDDDSHYKQKSMGIVLKRRDNAKIVKIVVGGIVDYILNGVPNETNISDRKKGAIEYTKTLLKKILKGDFAIDKYIVSKTLRGQYKNRTQIVHAVLADRIGERDPGNKPDVNDRVPYVYIIPKGKVTLQGERVEDPKFIVENSLEIDYLFYITNQIMKPASQFLEHIIKNPQDIFDFYINKELNRRKKLVGVNNYINNTNNNTNNIVNNSIISERLINKITLNKNVKSFTIKL